MKQKEKEIVCWLRNGERNISAIARSLELPISTAADRIKKIKEKYVIKHSSLLDYNKIGYFVNVFLVIKIDAEQRPQFLDFLKIQNCVNSIYSVDSGYNFLVELVCKDNMELINWIETLRKNFSLEIMQFQVLKTEEKEKFMSNFGGGI